VTGWPCKCTPFHTIHVYSNLHKNLYTEQLMCSKKGEVKEEEEEEEEDNF
jgi:hypothetical protein